MKTIHKYPLVPGNSVIPMPAHAELLDVQVQGGGPVLWALVDPEEPTVFRTFDVFGTGWELPSKLTAEEYVATFQTGPLVFHVFERLP